MGYFVCMHIINTCADRQRCESESFSTKWSAGRERNKEICSCQGSARLRLLPEIFWKNHTFEGLALCCLRISSSDQWNQKERERERERERGKERKKLSTNPKYVMNYTGTTAFWHFVWTITDKTGKMCHCLEKSHRYPSALICGPSCSNNTDRAALDMWPETSVCLIIPATLSFCHKRSTCFS